MSEHTDHIDSTAMNEVQLILAEKRTSLAVMRTGIAVLALPLSVLSVLIATSRYYDILRVIHLLVLLGAVNLGLMALGAYLIVRAMVRMKHHDRRIHEIKLKHRAIGRLID